MQLIKASHDNGAACNILRKMLQCRVITDVVHVMKNPSFRLEIFQTGLFPNIWHFKNQTIAFGGLLFLSNSKILESLLVHRPQKISGLCYCVPLTLFWEVTQTDPIREYDFLGPPLLSILTKVATETNQIAFRFIIYPRILFS